jgi:hypothetical protein
VKCEKDDPSGEALGTVSSSGKTAGHSGWGGAPSEIGCRWARFLPAGKPLGTVGGVDNFSDNFFQRGKCYWASFLKGERGMQGER